MSLTAVALNIGPDYGLAFVACFVSTALWGVSCMQTFIYFTNYPQDKRWIKLLVLGLWVLDTAHKVLIVMGLYRSLLTDFGSDAILTVISWEIIWSLLPAVLVSAIVQLFFTSRLYKFSGYKLIFPATLGPLIFAHVATTIVYMYDGLREPTASQLRRTGQIALVFNIVSAVVDTALAVCMVILLLKERTGVYQSDRVIVFLVVFTVNSGLWSAVVALAVVITLAVRPPPDMTCGALYLVLSSIYCNTMLGNLNSREFLRGRLHATVHVADYASRTMSAPQSIGMEPMTFRLTAIPDESIVINGESICKPNKSIGTVPSALHV